MKLSTLQKEIRQKEIDTLKDLEKEIAKEHRKVAKELKKIGSEYIERFDDALSGKQLKGLNIKIATVSTLTATEAIIFEKALKETLEQVYYGYMYSYSKVANSYLTYKALTPEQIKIITMDKIKGKTYLDRLAFHSKNLNKETASVIQNGLRNGLSNQQIAKGIAKRVNVSYNHALTIARTETGRIASQGAEKARINAVDQGLKFNRVWFHYSSESPRNDHVYMNGKTVKQDERFLLPNGETCYQPRIGLSAEQTVNCRCDVIEEFVGYESTERRQGKDIIPVKDYNHWWKSGKGRK